MLVATPDTPSTAKLPKLAATAARECIERPCLVEPLQPVDRRQQLGKRNADEAAVFLDRFKARHRFLLHEGQSLLARDHPLANLVAAESLLLAETADRAVYVVVQSRRAIADSPGRGRVPGGFPVVFSDQGSIDFLFVPR